MNEDMGASPLRDDRATHEPSPSVSALRVGIASAALLLVACGDDRQPQPPYPTYTPSPVASATEAAPPAAPEEPAAPPQPEYSGVKRVEINPDIYRICDGDSGRMIFVYAYNGYKQSRGGIVVLTGQGECQ